MSHHSKDTQTHTNAFAADRTELLPKRENIFQIKINDFLVRHAHALAPSRSLQTSLSEFSASGFAAIVWPPETRN